MDIKVKRLKSSPAAGGYTIGRMFIDGQFKYWTMEDEARALKLRGETRIPAGTYAVKFREVMSAKTQSYRNKYAWFKWHLELQNVPNFQYVYIHVGNTEKDTDGCILVGMAPDFRNARILQSAIAFEELYKAVAAELAAGQPVSITIEDE